uniref:WGS project CAEQ00000000 data, annotated contig 140 n=1 Tax=Trypanosoma congolense (strain IL3000) TaxID=1068625 RepID=F9W607_TRYCI|nr:unnamed protein product [Trypanosoma congolense IL3000]
MFYWRCSASVAVDFALRGAVAKRYCTTKVENNSTVQNERKTIHANAMPSADFSSKLNLSLQLGDLDIDAVVKATKAAMAKEKLWREVALAHESGVTNDTVKESVMTQTPLVSSSRQTDTQSVQPSHIVNKNDASAVQSPLRGGDVAGNCGTLSSIDIIPKQPVASTTRYGLMDSLRDCLLIGDWAKAMRMFQMAVQTACNNATEATSAPRTPPAVQDAQVTVDGEMLQLLCRINATSPADTSSMNLTRYRGILRWNGGHYYLLMKLLLSRHRVVEAEQVWDVMKRIGYVEFRMDERTFNRLMGLCLSTVTTGAALPVLQPKKEVADREKAFQEQLTSELKKWAEKRDITYGSHHNKQVARVARAANMVSGADASSDNDSLAKLNTGGLKVGDFAGLLRRCNSEQSTSRVLEMMEKCSVPRDGQIYSALIASLRQPHYQLSTESNEAPEVEGTKDTYDAYRRRRLQRARQWFEECPESQRIADVFNEMLLITRGGEAEDAEYDNLLLQFRGAPLRVSSDRGGDAEDSSNSKSSGPSACVVTPPQWRVPPNGKTYEVMIQHCRYRGEWPVLWTLYDEMMDRNVKGTRRLYQILMEVVHRHPPEGRDKNTVVLQLYEDMRRFGLELTDIRSTASVVNSWSATRRRFRW